MVRIYYSPIWLDNSKCSLFSVYVHIYYIPICLGYITPSMVGTSFLFRVYERIYYIPIWLGYITPYVVGKCCLFSVNVHVHLFITYLILYGWEVLQNEM